MRAHTLPFGFTQALVLKILGVGGNLLNLDIEVIVDDETCKNLPVLR